MRILSSTTPGTLSAGRDVREPTYAEYRRTFRREADDLAAFRRRYREGWLSRIARRLFGRAVKSGY